MVLKFHSGWKWEHLHEGNSNWTWLLGTGMLKTWENQMD
jgi:hypothetical protein